MGKKKIIVATGNKNKLREISEMLPDYEIIGYKEFFDEEIEETGDTFYENALIKARTVGERLKVSALADDSGLCVDALGGAPGVYSARFSGVHGDDEANNLKLLKELEGVPDEKRTAAYVSVICCVYPDGKKITVRGECRGRIGYTPKGTGGFGYDPYFLPDEYGYKTTMAELTPRQKDAISHRGKAGRALAGILGGNKIDK